GRPRRCERASSTFRPWSPVPTTNHGSSRSSYWTPVGSSAISIKNDFETRVGVAHIPRAVRVRPAGVPCRAARPQSRTAAKRRLKRRAPARGGRRRRSNEKLRDSFQQSLACEADGAAATSAPCPIVRTRPDGREQSRRSVVDAGIAGGGKTWTDQVRVYVTRTSRGPQARCRGPIRRGAVRRLRVVRRPARQARGPDRESDPSDLDSAAGAAA